MCVLYDYRYGIFVCKCVSVSECKLCYIIYVVVQRAKRKTAVAILVPQFSYFNFHMNFTCKFTVYICSLCMKIENKLYSILFYSGRIHAVHPCCHRLRALCCANNATWTMAFSHPVCLDKHITPMSIVETSIVVQRLLFSTEPNKNFRSKPCHGTHIIEAISSIVMLVCSKHVWKNYFSGFYVNSSAQSPSCDARQNIIIRKVSLLMLFTHIFVVRL